MGLTEFTAAGLLVAVPGRDPGRLRPGFLLVWRSTATLPVVNESQASSNVAGCRHYSHLLPSRFCVTKRGHIIFAARLTGWKERAAKLAQLGLRG